MNFSNTRLDDNSMTEAQWTTTNRAMLPLRGIGEDYFFLNKNFAEGKSTLSFPTLYDYDFADFQFQEKCRKAKQIDHSILIGRIEKEKELTQQFLNEKYADIMANFNGKIVKLAKKNRIIIHKDSGLGGLLD